MLNGLIIMIMIIPLSSEAKSDLVESYSADAKISLSVGDYYRSYKLYTHLYKKHPEYFKKHDLEKYLDVSFILSSRARFIRACDILARDKKIRKRVNYHCSKKLYESGDIGVAYTRIKQVDGSKNKIAILSKLLKASLQIEQEQYLGCLTTLSRDHVKSFRSYELDDIFHLTRARCYNSSNNYSSAVVEYQSVRSNSRYYFDSLVELSWTLFKLRDVERVHNTAKTILSTYKSEEEKLSKEGAHTAHYYQTQYFLAYLDLVIYSGQNEDKFTKLNKQIQKYQTSIFINKKDLNAFLKEVDIYNSYSSLALKSDVYARVTYHLGQWLDFNSMKDLDNAIAMTIATRKEFNRSKNLSQRFSKYKNAMQKLNQHYKDKLEHVLHSTYADSLNNIQGFILKNRIGSLDLKNLEKTAGLRSLDEASTNYKDKEGNLKDKFGVLQ